MLERFVEHAPRFIAAAGVPERISQVAFVFAEDDVRAGRLIERF